MHIMSYNQYKCVWYHANINMLNSGVSKVIEFWKLNFMYIFAKLLHKGLLFIKAITKHSADTGTFIKKRNFSDLYVQ